MATRIGNRFALTRAASVAVAEARLASRAVPGVLRSLVPIVAWGSAAIILGTVVGFAAVVLPPMGAFGLVAPLALLLLWVMPEMPLVFPRLIRKTFFVMLFINLCLPTYYMVQIPGLPWISARRLSSFALIVPFFLAVSSSSRARDEIIERLRAAPPIVICVLGFLVMAVLSVFTSKAPQESISALRADPRS